MTPLNSAKCAELQIMVWFLEAGWEVFTPVVDANQTDLVVRIPTTQEIVAVQIKHKERGRLNEGWLKNHWKTGTPPFDYLLLFQPEKTRGVIFHRESFRQLPPTIEVYLRDRNGYSNRDFRDRFVDISFDLGAVPEGLRASSFAQRFLAIHSGGLRPRPAKFVRRRIAPSAPTKRSG